MAYLRLRYSITQYNVIRGAFHRSPPEIPRRHHESQSRFMRKSYTNSSIHAACNSGYRPKHALAVLDTKKGFGIAPKTLVGGVRGIRTLEPLNTTNTLAGCPYRPLRHDSTVVTVTLSRRNSM